MTSQEAFDKALSGLRAQGRRAGVVSCFYRSESAPPGVAIPPGLRCAIGMLIPDEEYTPDLEGKAADFIARRVPSLGGLDLLFLYRMQWEMHDNLDSNLSGLEGAAQKVASEFGLTYTPPERG